MIDIRQGHQTDVFNKCSGKYRVNILKYLDYLYQSKFPSTITLNKFCYNTVRYADDFKTHIGLGLDWIGSQWSLSVFDLL